MAQMTEAQTLEKPNIVFICDGIGRDSVVCRASSGIPGKHAGTRGENIFRCENTPRAYVLTKTVEAMGTPRWHCRVDRTKQHCSKQTNRQMNE